MEQELDKLKAQHQSEALELYRLRKLKDKWELAMRQEQRGRRESKMLAMEAEEQVEQLSEAMERQTLALSQERDEARAEAEALRQSLEELQQSARGQWAEDSGRSASDLKWVPEGTPRMQHKFGSTPAYGTTPREGPSPMYGSPVSVAMDGSVSNIAYEIPPAPGPHLSQWDEMREELLLGQEVQEELEEQLEAKEAELAALREQCRAVVMAAEEAAGHPQRVAAGGRGAAAGARNERIGALVAELACAQQESQEWADRYEALLSEHVEAQQQLQRLQGTAPTGSAVDVDAVGAAGVSGSADPSPDADADARPTFDPPLAEAMRAQVLLQAEVDALRAAAAELGAGNVSALKQLSAVRVDVERYQREAQRLQIPGAGDAAETEAGVLQPKPRGESRPSALQGVAGLRSNSALEEALQGQSMLQAEVEALHAAASALGGANVAALQQLASVRAELRSARREAFRLETELAAATGAPPPQQPPEDADVDQPQRSSPRHNVGTSDDIGSGTQSPPLITVSAAQDAASAAQPQELAAAPDVQPAVAAPTRSHSCEPPVVPPGSHSHDVANAAPPVAAGTGHAERIAALERQLAECEQGQEEWAEEYRKLQLEAVAAQQALARANAAQRKESQTGAQEAELRQMAAEKRALEQELEAALTQRDEALKLEQQLRGALTTQTYELQANEEELVAVAAERERLQVAEEELCNTLSDQRVTMGMMEAEKEELERKLADAEERLEGALQELQTTRRGHEELRGRLRASVGTEELEKAFLELRTKEAEDSLKAACRELEAVAASALTDGAEGGEGQPESVTVSPEVGLGNGGGASGGAGVGGSGGGGCVECTALRAALAELQGSRDGAGGEGQGAGEGASPAEKRDDAAGEEGGGKGEGKSEDTHVSDRGPECGRDAGDVGLAGAVTSGIAGHGGEDVEGAAGAMRHGAVCAACGALRARLEAAQAHTARQKRQGMAALEALRCFEQAAMQRVDGLLTPDPRSAVAPEAEPMCRSQLQPQLQPKPQSAPQLQLRSLPHSQNEPQPQPQPKPKTGPQPEPEPHPHAQRHPRPQSLDPPERAGLTGGGETTDGARAPGPYPVLHQGIVEAIAEAGLSAEALFSTLLQSPPGSPTVSVLGQLQSLCESPKSPGLPSSSSFPTDKMEHRLQQWAAEVSHLRPTASVRERGGRGCSETAYRGTEHRHRAHWCRTALGGQGRGGLQRCTARHRAQKKRRTGMHLRGRTAKVEN